MDFVSDDGNNLMFQEEMQLSEASEIVQSVIAGKMKYQTLSIMADYDLFHENFQRSKASKLFWKKLGETVVTLQIYNILSDSIFAEYCFKNLRKLVVCNANLFKFIPKKIFQNNCGLETIMFEVKTINAVSLTKHEINNEFTEMLTIIMTECTSLKILIFPCEMPLVAEVFNEIFSKINQEILDMDEMLIDCEPLPCWEDYANYYWIVERIEMEFLRSNDSRKLIVKPLKLVDELKDGRNACEENCLLSHKEFRCKTLQEGFFKDFVNGNAVPQRRCYRYYKSFIKSFPFVRVFTTPFKTDDLILNLISENLKQLYFCVFNHFTDVRNWPSFPNIKKVSVIFKFATVEDFENFVKAIPKVEELYVRIENGITDDDCVHMISKHLKNIEHLHVTCENSRLTASGLDIIGNNLKKLRKLIINCSESKDSGKQLFNQLPYLQNMDGYRWLITKDDLVDMNNTTTLDNVQVDNQSTELLIEIWEKIFCYLDKYDQLKCRQVCQFWFDIFSSNSTLYRTLDFSKSYLSTVADPVKIFMNTNFNYNRIVFNKDTNVAEGENLTKLWDRIGNEVEEIIIRGDATPFINIFKTGLTAKHLPHLTSFVFETFSYFNNLLTEQIPEFNLLLSQIKILKFHSHSVVPELHIRNPGEILNIEELLIRDNSQVILNCLNHLNFPKITKFLCISETRSENPKEHPFDLELLFKTNLKFTQLSCLFVGKTSKWNICEIELITKSCFNLKCLGLCFQTDIFDFRSKFENYDEIFEASSRSEVDGSCANVARKIFDQMDTLRDIYFVLHSTYGAGSKFYSRSGDNCIASDRFYCPFSDFFNTEVVL